MGEDNPKIKRWDEVDYCKRSVDLQQKEFAYDIFEVLWELDEARMPIVYHGEVIDDLEVNKALYKWIQAMSLKSSMIQALFCCRGEAYNLLGTGYGAQAKNLYRPSA